MDAERLKRAGIDYDAGLARFLGDRALYEEVLRAFLSDGTLEAAQSAFRAGDGRALFACAHEVKGSSGNTDMTRLHTASRNLVALLRELGFECSGSELQAAFECFEEAYITALEGIREAMGE